jgi:hypothetical protein
MVVSNMKLKHAGSNELVQEPSVRQKTNPGFNKAWFRDAASFADGKNGWPTKSGFKKH